jgi:hypothetical protein
VKAKVEIPITTGTKMNGWIVNETLAQRLDVLTHSVRV